MEGVTGCKRKRQPFSPQKGTREDQWTPRSCQQGQRTLGRLSILLGMPGKYPRSLKLKASWKREKEGSLKGIGGPRIGLESCLEKAWAWNGDDPDEVVSHQ